MVRNGTGNIVYKTTKIRRSYVEKLGKTKDLQQEWPKPENRYGTVNFVGGTW